MGYHRDPARELLRAKERQKSKWAAHLLAFAERVGQRLCALCGAVITTKRANPRQRFCSDRCRRIEGKRAARARAR